MAVKTWYIENVNVGGATPNRLWYDEDGSALPAQTTSVTGWNVGNVAANNYADLNNGTEVARGTFATTILPNATAPTVDANFPATAIYTPPTLLTSADSISTLYEYNGVFPAGTWTFNFPVIATSAGNQDGRIRLRVYRGLRSGTAWASVTEITSAALDGTLVTNLTAAAAQTSTVTWSAPAFRLQNEFLIIKIAWQITGAGGNNARNVRLRYGTGATMVSPTFKKSRHILGG